MPDITHPLVATPFVAGDTLDPSRVAEGLYRPKISATVDNMSVMNGQLDEPNLATPYSITYDIVRPGAMATARTVGHTANLDFFADWYGGDWDETSRTSMAQVGQVANGIKFYVPYTCTVIKLRWQVGVIVDGGHVRLQDATLQEDGDEYYGTNHGSDKDNASLLSLFIDGVEQTSINRRIRTGTRSPLGQVYYTAANTKKPLPGSGAGNYDHDFWNEPMLPDHRWWNGHFNIDSGTALQQGWHTASIRVTPGKWDIAGATLPDGTQARKVAPLVRFKTCNFTAIPIR